MKNLRVLEAVETLSQLSQVSDGSHPELLPRPERIKRSFETLKTYLIDLYQHQQMLLQNHDYLASLKAVMIIAEEAYDKLDLMAKIFSTSKQDLGEGEFNHLFDFYLKKVNFKVEHVASDVFRHSEEEKKRALTDTHGLKNLETIRKDTDYELFYIKDSQGLSFFSKNLLRHTQLLGTFDELFLSFTGEDPFIKLKFIEDRLKQKRALLVRQELASRIDFFLKEAFRFKKLPFIGLTCSMMNALFLASYPSLVLQNDPYKACFEYFDDLIVFLTALVSKPEFYKTGSSIELVSDKGILASQRFVGGVISHLYFSKNDTRYIAEHLYHYVQRPQVESFSPISFFDKLLEFDQSLRKLLANFPSGPLMKALDFIKDGDQNPHFAPLHNLSPQNLYNLTASYAPISVVVMGSATVQQHIDSAQIEPLFQVFIGQLNDQKTLIINLENPHNEHHLARIKALKPLEAENVMFAVIPRSGIFYEQLETYSFIDEAFEFKKIFLEQFDRHNDNTYSHAHITSSQIEPVFELIHKRIFDHRSQLDLKDRLTFIEVAQLFMSLILMEKTQSQNLIIMCKDGLDHSNAYSLSLYALVAMINHEVLLTSSTLELFISELYGPAMTLRDRPIFESSVMRMFSALSVLYAKMTKEPVFIKELQALFPILVSLKIQST
jgi:hypothetical protein